MSPEPEVPAVPDEGLAEGAAEVMADYIVARVPDLTKREGERITREKAVRSAGRLIEALAAAGYSIVPAASVPAPSGGLTEEERSVYEDWQPDADGMTNGVPTAHDMAVLVGAIRRLAASVPAVGPDQRYRPWWANKSEMAPILQRYAPPDADDTWGFREFDTLRELGVIDTDGQPVPAVGPGEGEREFVKLSERVPEGWKVVWESWVEPPRSEAGYFVRHQQPRLVPVSADPRIESPESVKETNDG